MRARTIIRDAREAAGLTQAELARRAGIPRSVLNVYERGKREPGAEALLAIVHAAGYRLRLEPLVDEHHNARVLSQVLDLAERLPWRPRRRLAYPPFLRRVG